MTSKRVKVGIMGGTFDPIHYGHLVTAEGARYTFGLDQVLFLPAGRPPHKRNTQVTDSEHRYMMTVLATLTNPYFEVSRLEIDRKGTSYTIDTLRILREQYGPEAELFFITGADAIFDISSWKNSDECLELAHFVAATRPGFSLEDLPESTQQWVAKHQERFHILRVPAMAISSTEVRERVRQGSSIRYLVPEPVEHYIRRQHLYAEPLP
ncbi:MAG TPA: nicotinate-nucleotide adenylyltransferase [Firmicutes bacterium]|jgi:nicotinate-nucleotide adenylyltransferase|nr:nicotinate-nucleotide adenylyltransferase [Bacillota bacterium]HHT43400.1 nicotinate-nucleotide adenylyltransferase [Bacillota bacterium]